MPKHVRHSSIDSVSSVSSSCSTSSSSETRRQRLKRTRQEIETDLNGEFRFITSLSAASHRQFKYQATNLHTGRLCALWVCPIESSKQLRLLQGTYLAMKTYNHKNLPRLQNIQYTPKYALLSWDYCPHQSAKSLTYATTDGLSELSILSILKDSLSALTYLHDQGQVHGNISLENMKYSVNHNVKLHGCNVWQSTNKDSLEYNAPEIIFDQQTDGNMLSCDLWALGIAFYIMLTRSLKFSNCQFIKYDSNGNTSTHVNGILQHPKVSDLSRNGKMLIYGLLTVDPEERLDAKRASTICKLAISRLSKS